MPNNTYLQNTYMKLKKQGFPPKYDRPGIYCITIDGKYAYIGKSKNILYRMAQHYVNTNISKEKKYQVLAEARRRRHQVRTIVLYEAKAQTDAELEEELGAKEGEFIRKYLPPLNTQIPKAENWHSFEEKSIETITLEQVLSK